MTAILLITAPIYLLLALGYFSIHQNWFDAKQLQGIGAFVLKIGLPALILTAVSKNPIEVTLDLPYLVSYALGSLAIYVLCAVYMRYKRQASWAVSALNGMGMSSSNSSFIGYPLLAIIIGEQQAVHYLALGMLVENLLILPLTLIIAEREQHHESICKMLLTTLNNLLKTPLIIAILLGLFLALTGLKLPSVLDKIVTMLASSAAPLALFAIGGKLYGLRLRGTLADIVSISMGKLFLHPLAVFMCLSAFAVDEQTRFAGTLLAAVPMASVYPLLGQRYGIERQCAAVLLLATVISYFSITLLLYFYRL